MVKKNRSFVMLVAVVVLVAGVAVYAWHAFYALKEPEKKPEAKPAVQQPAAQLTKDHHFCPKPSALVRKGQLWEAPGGWRSYTASFVKNIAGFGGAQWIGIRVGKIICLYKGKVADTFPVTLERDNLAHSPEDFRWGKDLGGYKNCHSSDVEQCPFLLVKSTTPEKADPKSIYEGLGKS